MMNWNDVGYGKSCKGKEVRSGSAPHPPARGLDDRIRHLCARVVEASEEELASTVADLQAALREHSDRLRKLAVRKLTHLSSTPQQSSG